MKDPVIIDRDDLEYLINKTAAVAAAHATKETINEIFKIIGLKPHDVNRTINASEALRMCSRLGVRVGRRRLMQNVPYKCDFNKKNSRIEFKEKDVLKYLNK